MKDKSKETKYIMALDAGTTSCRCIIFDKKSNILSIAQKEISQSFPAPGRFEEDAEEIWEAQVGTAKDALETARISASDIAAIGIANQRETAVLWDRETGKPVYPAIVWQDKRTSRMCDNLIEKGLLNNWKKLTGLVIDPYFSATKIWWILNNVPGAMDKAKEGRLLFGTVDTWLIWKLSGGKVHATDYSNASRTMLFNIGDLCWEDSILRELNIPKEILPEVKPSGFVYCNTEAEIFGSSIPVAGAVGDQQASLFGQMCFEPGSVKCTYGTGCFLLMNTGNSVVNSENGLVSTIGWGLDGKIEYALEGSVFVAGSLIKWLRDQLNIIETSADSENLAKQVENTAGCYIVPAFSGLGAPYWDPHARGIITGLSFGTDKRHIVRAALESIAYQAYDVLYAMETDIKKKIVSLKADGGASANNLLMQMQADIIQAKVIRPSCVETTALGAAFLAGLTVGYWKNREEILGLNNADRFFVPGILPDEQRDKIKKWKTAVNRARG